MSRLHTHPICQGCEQADAELRRREEEIEGLKQTVDEAWARYEDSERRAERRAGAAEKRADKLSDGLNASWKERDALKKRVGELEEFARVAIACHDDNNWILEFKCIGGPECAPLSATLPHTRYTHALQLARRALEPTTQGGDPPEGRSRTPRTDHT